MFMLILYFLKIISLKIKYYTALNYKKTVREINAFKPSFPSISNIMFLFT